jgi:hypothetical protein
VLGAEKAPAQTVSVPQPELSYNIPVNPSVNDRIAYNPETAFGAFAWKAFVALNWPANSDGSPLTGKTIGEAPDAPRVWEFYQAPEEVFNPKSKQSTGQKVQNLRLTEINANETLAQLRERALSEYKEGNPSQDLLSIFPDIESADILVEGFEPLVDRSGNYILNEVRMNPVEVAQINENHWYDAANLQNFDNQDNRFQLMCSAKDSNGIYPYSPFDKVPCSDNKSVGTIELKAAWMVFPDPVPDELRSKYYTTTRTFDVETPESTGKEKTKVTVPVGLVGFHIVQKTSQQGWTWATFEHLNNAPDADNLPSDGDYNLYDSNCKENCEVNTPHVEKPYLWRNEFPHAVTKTETGEIKEQTPSQITRLVSIPSIARSLNSKWQEALAEVPNASVWQNYQLVGVQWLNNPYIPYNDDERKITPKQLANVTLEPYVQTSKLGSSCISCHTFARLPVSSTIVPADFSFLMERAKQSLRPTGK